MNTESVNCRKVEPGNVEQVGDFCFDEAFEYLYLWLPGTTGPCAIQIRRGDPGGPRIWGWDGNEDKPTLTPSIHAREEWHGFLKAGRLESC